MKPVKLHPFMEIEFELEMEFEAGDMIRAGNGI
jgi:hypothetical protein